jgi:hypothetical protein
MGPPARPRTLTRDGGIGLPATNPSVRRRRAIPGGPVCNGDSATDAHAAREGSSGGHGGRWGTPWEQAANVFGGRTGGSS